MDQIEFNVSLTAALRVCRGAAEAAIPIEEMLAFVDGAREMAGPGPHSGGLAGAVVELDALTEVIQAVGDVVAIGKRFIALDPPRPIRVLQPGEGSTVRPANFD